MGLKGFSGLSQTHFEANPQVFLGQCSPQLRPSALSESRLEPSRSGLVRKRYEFVLRQRPTGRRNRTRLPRPQMSDYRKVEQLKVRCQRR